MVTLIVCLIFAVFAVTLLAKTAVVVPQQSAYVVERLGRYHATLGAGFYVLLPFVDIIRYRHTLKERAMEIQEQVCITCVNVQVAVDGILYFKVFDPKSASYGISNFEYAITQLAQTTLRSDIGKIELDRTFEERTRINIAVVTELDKASEPWGVKVLRYEIKNIIPPKDVLAAMEKQMRAEREKRAVILQSEGVRDSVINAAEGDKQKVIKASEGNKQQQINQAEAKPPLFWRSPRRPLRESGELRNRLKAPEGLRQCSFELPSSIFRSSASSPKRATLWSCPWLSAM